MNTDPQKRIEELKKMATAPTSSAPPTMSDAVERAHIIDLIAQSHEREKAKEKQDAAMILEIRQLRAQVTNLPGVIIGPVNTAVGQHTDLEARDIIRWILTYVQQMHRWIRHAGIAAAIMLMLLLCWLMIHFANHFLQS